MSQPGSAPVREGDLLAGKYRVQRVLGIGGMGVVVAARHEGLEQLVAIKFVHGATLGTGDAVDRFLREARAAAKLKSEHVAKVLDVGILESGAPYIVMEFLEGRDLGQVLAADGPMSVQAAADYVLQACEAVSEAHSAGIIHRDLKPQNLFLTRAVGGAAKVKVLDFGVSKSIDPMGGGLVGLTRTSAMLGSPLYMSPEQMRSSRDVDPRADVWALGVVLFELLTCRWPFEAETMPALCLKVVSDPPQSLAELRPDVPPEMVAIVERCLAKDLTRRYANAAELASALAPLAPPASRVLAERARFLMGNPPRPTPVEPRTGASSPSTPSGPTPGRLEPTPAAWGSNRGSSSAALRPARRVRLAVGFAMAVLGVATVAAAILAFHATPAGTPGAAPSGAVSASVVGMTPLASAVVAAPEVSASATSVLLVPVSGADSAPVVPASAASAQWTAPNRTSAMAPPTTTAKAFAPWPYPAVSSTAAASAPKDDDIPTRR